MTLDHFEYIEWFNSKFFLEFNLEESIFCKNIIQLNELIAITSKRTPDTLKTSEVLATIYTRANMNYLIGSYLSIRNCLPSFSMMGMRAVIEYLVRGYYYLCNEDFACISYIYILAQSDEVEMDKKSILTLQESMPFLNDPDIINICDEIIQERDDYKFDKNKINEMDKNSRSYRKVIDKIYTNARQKRMREIWSELSRYSHAGIMGRFKDINYRDSDRDFYQNNIDTLLFLLSSNVIFFIEAFWEYIDNEPLYVESIVKTLANYPAIFTPNKTIYKDKFRLSTSDNYKKYF